MTQDTKSPIEKVQDVARVTGFTFYPDYSGRCMYGELCVGVVTPTPEAVGAVIKAAKRRGLSGHMRDALGLGAVIYWPHIQQKVSPSTAAANRLKDYLRGYGRNQVEKLDQLASLNGWEAAATQVLQARRFALLSAFDDELLNFIERGQVSVQEAALAVAHDLKSKESAGAAHD